MISTTALRRMLNYLNATGAQIDSITVKLFKAPITLTPAVEPTDFTEADFSGYAAATAAPAGTAWDDTLGQGVLSYGSVHFQGTTGAVTNNIFGWWAEVLLDAVTVCVVAAEVFPAPIAVNGSADAIDFVPYVKLGVVTDL